MIDLTKDIATIEQRQIDWLNKILLDIVEQKYWGKIELQYESGHIVNLRAEQTLKPLIRSIKEKIPEGKVYIPHIIVDGQEIIPSDQTVSGIIMQGDNGTPENIKKKGRPKKFMTGRTGIVQ